MRTTSRVRKVASAIKDERGNMAVVEGYTATAAGPECASHGDFVTHAREEPEPPRFTASKQVSDMPIAKLGNPLDPNQSIPRPRVTAGR